MSEKKRAETQREKSKRLEEELIQKQRSKRQGTPNKTIPRNSDVSSPFFPSDVKIKRQEQSNFGIDLGNIHIVKTEPVNIREQLTPKDTEVLLHPLQHQYWIHHGASIVSNPHIQFLFFLSLLSATFVTLIVRIVGRKQQEPPQSSRSRQMSYYTIADFVSLVSHTREMLFYNPNRVEMNRFITILSPFSSHFDGDDEFLGTVIGQLSYLYEDADSQRECLEAEFEVNIDHWFQPLLRAKYCLELAGDLNSFQEKLLKTQEKLYGFQLQRRLSSLNLISSEHEIESLTIDTVSQSSTAVSAMLQSVRHQQQSETHRRDRDDAIREIDRNLQYCRDRSHSKRDQSKRLRKLITRRKNLLAVMNRSIFVSVFTVAVIVFWSLQSSCPMQGDWSSYLQCTLAGTLQTTCSYMEYTGTRTDASTVSTVQSDRPESSSLFTLAFAPMTYMENLFENPTSTVRSTILQAPLNVLSTATSILTMVMAGRAVLPSSLDYVFCGGFFLARCLPAYAMQVIFNMVYLSSIGSFFSWALMLLFFYDVVLKLLQEPLWPLIILLVIQLVFYFVSWMEVHVDITRRVMVFYLIYIMTIASFPFLWRNQDWLLEVYHASEAATVAWWESLHVVV